MSTASATDTGAAKKGGKKKLLMIIIGVLVLALGGGTAALLLLKKPAADEYAEEDADAQAPGAKAPKARNDPKAVPAFVPLDPFTVNLADRDQDRFAQIGITLELLNADSGAQIKAYMPAIRDRILMAIADRTAAKLLGREGKMELADQLRRDTSTVLGYEVPDPAPKDGVEDPKAERRRLAAERGMPVQAVHFSNFIVQ